MGIIFSSLLLFFTFLHVFHFCMDFRINTEVCVRAYTGDKVYLLIG